MYTYWSKVFLCCTGLGFSMWCGLAHDRVQWQAFTNAEINEIWALLGYYAVYGGNSRHLQGSRNQDTVTLEDGDQWSLTSVRNYHHMWHTIPEECRTHLLCSRSLKSCAVINRVPQQEGNFLTTWLIISFSVPRVGWFVKTFLFSILYNDRTGNVDGNESTLPATVFWIARGLFIKFHTWG